MKHFTDASLDTRLGFFGTAGSGKTYGAGVLVERLLASKRRTVIIDPLGVWYGLRADPAGRPSDAFPVVIFGGPHGDLSLSPLAGGLIGETVAETTDSCIIDLSELGTKAAERRFMLAFLDALYRKTKGTPIHVVFDEADMWAPQKLLDKEGEAAKLLGQMETIVRRGRVRGFIPWLITQRPAVLSKDVLSQADGLVIFKLTSSQDRKAIGAWVEGQADEGQWRQIYDALPGKERGHAVVWMPASGTLEGDYPFPAKATFDSSATPKRGERKALASLKPLDVGALKERMAAVEKEAVANDPKTLKAEIARLQKELSGKAGQLAAAPDLATIADAEQRGYARGHADGVRKVLDGVSHIAGDVAAAADRLVDDATRAKGLFGSLATFVDSMRTAAPAPNAPRSPTPLSSPSTMSRTVVPPVKPNVDSGPKNTVADGLTGPQRHLLAAMAWWARMGHAEPTRTQLAAKAGWTPKGSNLRNRLSELSSAGLVEYPRDRLVRLTAAGVAAAPDPDMSETLIGSIRQILTGPQSQLFEALLDSFGNGMSRAQLAEAVGWEPGGSNLRNRLSELSSLEIVEYPAKGEVALQAWVTG